MFRNTLIALAATATLALAPGAALAKGGHGHGKHGHHGHGHHGHGHHGKHGHYGRKFRLGYYGVGYARVYVGCWVKVYTPWGVRYEYACPF